MSGFENSLLRCFVGTGDVPEIREPKSSIVLESEVPIKGSIDEMTTESRQSCRTPTVIVHFIVRLLRTCHGRQQHESRIRVRWHGDGPSYGHPEASRRTLKDSRRPKPRKPLNGSLVLRNVRLGDGGR